jgi:hypothetical protein
MRWLILGLVGAVFAMPFPALSQPEASPSLVAALHAVRTADANAVEAQIRALDGLDREALLFWLRSHGRDALHQRGATDKQIGPPWYPIDYKIIWTTVPAGFTNPLAAATPTPEPAKQGGSNFMRGLFGFVSGLPLPNVSVPIASSSSSSTKTWVEGNTRHTETHSSSSQVSAQVNVSGLVGMLAQAAEQSGSHVPEEPKAPNLRWTLLEFGRPPAEPHDSGILVHHGVAGVRNNSEGAACVSFTNQNPKTIREVDFDFTFIDRYDRSLQTMALRRVGLVAQNGTVDAPHDLTPPAKVLREASNCVMMGHVKPNAAPIPSLIRAAALAYGVRRVVFEDGTVWQRPGTNAWPPSSELPGLQP